MNLERNVTYTNDAFTALTGFSAEDIIGRKQHPQIHHTKMDGTPYPIEDCLIYKTLLDGTSRTVTEEAFWRKDGTSFPVGYTCTLIKENNNIIGVNVVFRDITKRKEVENALKRNQESLADAQLIAHIGNWEWDVQSYQWKWSDEIYSILSIKPKDVELTFETIISFRIIHDGTGTHFDPAVFEAFFAVEEEIFTIKEAYKDREQSILYLMLDSFIKSNVEEIFYSSQLQSCTASNMATMFSGGTFARML